MNERKRLLIEDWLPIAEIGIESLRERTPMTPFPAPNRLHVWFARRPLVASRAAILGSLLPADFDRKKFLHTLGIHGDPVASRQRINEATSAGIRLGTDAYGYPRAFQHLPAPGDLPPSVVVLDPTAGGGSIPFEAARLGGTAVANDLNPVAALLLRATVELPLQFGTELVHRVEELGEEWVRRVRQQLVALYPDEPNGWICDGYLWARTITCPYCSGIVPLSPNWKLSGDGTGVRLVPEKHDGTRRIRFEIVKRAHVHSPGTVKGGDGLCPFPDCGRTIDGDDVKKQAQAGQMGH